MDKYKRILEQVRGKNNKKAKEKEADAIAEVLCLSVDASPHMIAMEDGAAMLAALYTLCLDDGINTIGAYLEIRGRLDNLLDDMYDKMREIYPVPSRMKSEDKSEPAVMDMLKRMRAISTKERRDHNDLDG